MPDFVDGAVLKQHFDDVEANFDLGIVEQTEVIERSPGEALTPLFIHGRGRTRPVFGGAGFDLDKHEAILVAKNQVNLTTRRPEVCGEKFHSLPLELLFGGQFAHRAVPQVDGPGRFAPPGRDQLGNIHSPRNALIAVPHPFSKFGVSKTNPL